MSRLPRPYIPYKVRCRVILMQLEAPSGLIEHCIAENKGHYKAYWNELMLVLAGRLGCAPGDLHCDHDPPLAARRIRTVDTDFHYLAYEPDANDPDHLKYRVKRDHNTKTYIRGEHGQFPDVALIKRERRRRRGGRRQRGPGLSPCSLGRERCTCERRDRKRCPNYRVVKIARRITPRPNP